MCECNDYGSKNTCGSGCSKDCMTFRGKGCSSTFECAAVDSCTTGSVCTSARKCSLGAHAAEGSACPTGVCQLGRCRYSKPVTTPPTLTTQAYDNDGSNDEAAPAESEVHGIHWWIYAVVAGSVVIVILILVAACCSLMREKRQETLMPSAPVMITKSKPPLEPYQYPGAESRSRISAASSTGSRKSKATGGSHSGSRRSGHRR